MLEKSMKIQLKNGLEARPVAVLVQVASQHESSVYIESAGKKVNAKSIMGMMTLGMGRRGGVSLTGLEVSTELMPTANQCGSPTGE